MADRCPVCDDSHLAEIRAHGSYRLWECPGCGVQHWTPLVHPDAAYYEEEAHAMYEVRHRGETRREPRYDPFFDQFGNTTGKRVLDVGCSDGWFLSEMKTRGNDVYGIDIDARALEAARGRGLTQVSQSSVEDFIADATKKGLRFDLITMFDVLEHTTDPTGVLRSLSTLLADGGVLAGTVPNRRRFLADEVTSDFPPHHFYRFDANALRGCVERAGLGSVDVLCFQYGYTGPTAIAAVWRRLRTLRNLDSNKAAAPKRATARRDGTGTPAWRKAAARVLTTIARTPSKWIEQPLNRGFKLYFVARAG